MNIENGQTVIITTKGKEVVQTDSLPKQTVTMFLSI